MPLPTWLLILTLAVCPLLFRKPLAPATTSRPRRRWVRILLQVIYYFSIFVIILMETVEIARLARADLGIALLPFVYAGCLLAGAVQATGAVRGGQAANLLFWTLGLCITAVKTAAVARFGTTGPLARQDTAYPIDHQITDLVILIIFYGLLMGLEIAMMFVKPGYRAVPATATGEK